MFDAVEAITATLTLLPLQICTCEIQRECRLPLVERFVALALQTVLVVCSSLFCGSDICANKPTLSYRRTDLKIEDPF